MGKILPAPGLLKNMQGQIDHALDLYQDIKDNNLKPLTITIDPVTNANGSYSHTTEDERITEDMKAVTIEVGTPEVFFAPVVISTGDGTVTLTCEDAHGTSTVTVTFIHTWPVDGGEDVPESVTSTEFDILADRIGVLSNLTTTDKTDIVHAVNEVKEQVEFVDTTNVISNLLNIPVNSQGMIRLDASVSPTGEAIYCVYHCFGDPELNGSRCVMVTDYRNNKEYSNTFYSNAWKGWKLLADNADVTSLSDQIGNLDNLYPPVKTDMVSAINSMFSGATHSSNGTFTKQLSPGKKYLVIFDRYSVTSSTYVGLYFVDCYASGAHVSPISTSSAITSISIADSGVLSYTTNTTYMRMAAIMIGG